MHSKIQAIFTCKFLSNKESKAPLIYCLLQIFLLLALVSACPYFIDFQNQSATYLFWAWVLITISLYFVTHRMDPGYIPHDAVFFTDQDNSSQAQTPSSNLNSVRKLKGPFVFPGQIDNLFATAKTNIEDIIKSNQNERRKSLPLKSGKGGETYAYAQTTDKLSTTDKFTNTYQSPSGPIISISEKNTKENEPTKEDINPSHIQSESYEQEDNEKENKNENRQSPEETTDKPSQDIIVECEASLEELEHGHDQTNFDKTDPKMSSYSEDDLRRHMENKRLTYPSLQGIQEELEKSQAKPTNESSNSNPRVDRETTKKEGLWKENRDMETTGRVGKSNVTGRRSSRGGSENIDVTQEAKETQRDNKLTKPMANKAYRELDESIEKPSGDISDLPSTVKMGSFEMKPKKPQFTVRTPESTKNVQFFMKKEEDNIELEDMKDPKEGELLYVERRYCTACNIEQPFRAKHCKDCSRCIAQFDHHCPWLGTCIGEKNHLMFYFFLMVQAVQIGWGEIKLFEQVLSEEHENWLSQSTLNIILLIIITFFFMMVILLWLFHSYLAMKNLTTWESLSWEKISYLREWKAEWGSPFSKGVWGNLYFFCCADKTQLQKWRLPKYKKNLEE